MFAVRSSETACGKGNNMREAGMKIAKGVLAVGLALSFLMCATPQVRAADSLFTYEGGTFQVLTEKENYWTSESIPVTAQYTNVSDSRKDLGNNYKLTTTLSVIDLGIPSNLQNPNLAPSIFSTTMSVTKITYVLPHASDDIATATIPAYKLSSGHVYKVHVQFNALLPNGTVLSTEAEKLIRAK